MERIYRYFWRQKGDVYALLWDMQRCELYAADQRLTLLHAVVLPLRFTQQCKLQLHGHYTKVTGRVSTLHRLHFSIQDHHSQQPFSAHVLHTFLSKLRAIYAHLSFTDGLLIQVH
jgi:hypothetical protein